MKGVVYRVWSVWCCGQTIPASESSQFFSSEETDSWSSGDRLEYVCTEVRREDGSCTGETLDLNGGPRAPPGVPRWAVHAVLLLK